MNEDTKNTKITYLVTYSQDDLSIVGWDANFNEEGKLIPEYTVKLSDIIGEFNNLNQICVSDDKRLACIYNDRKFLKIINMSDNNLEMKISGSVYNMSVSSRFEAKIEDIKIAANGKFVCLRIKDKIIIHSIELEIPIASLNLNNDIQIYNFMNHTSLYLLLLPLLSQSSEIWNQIMKYYWKKCLGAENLPLPNNISIATKYTFGILSGHVWKIKLEEKILKNELPIKDYEETNEMKRWKGWNMYLCSDEKETYDHLNIHLFCSCIDTIRALIDEVIPILSEFESFDENDLAAKHNKTDTLTQYLIK
ncbi:hypothetical protein RclHR1_01230015 [Rhizophagus clarus]|uniref:Uncharacterized protein n=1 Tax=Rhizophagus clarus TaxID=94130 RepID=A0A2Z6QBJ4_9GLOM|nr:hypothetical protein RclHR1_01230015 [Rhizophagus clarus]